MHLLTFTSILSVHCKYSGFIHCAMNQSWAIGSDMATVDIIHIKLQWASWNQIFLLKYNQTQHFFFIYMPANPIRVPNVLYIKRCTSRKKNVTHLAHYTVLTRSYTSMSFPRSQLATVAPIIQHGTLIHTAMFVDYPMGSA